MNSENKSPLRVKQLIAELKLVSQTKSSNFSKPKEPSYVSYVIADSPPIFSVRKRKSSTKTEESSPPKIRINSLEVDQIIDLSTTSSSGSTIIYEYNCDSGFDSALDKTTDIVLPQEKLDLNQCSPNIVNIIQLSDVPLSPHSKCLKWISAPEPDNDVEEISVSEATKTCSKKPANKQNDLDIPNINIPESSNVILTTPVNLLDKSTQQQDTKDQHQHEIFSTEPEISIGDVPKITTKSVNLSSKSKKQQVTKNQHQHEIFTVEPEISIGDVPETTTNTVNLSNKFKKQVTKSQHQPKISITDVRKTTTNIVKLLNKSTNKSQLEMFTAESEIFIKDVPKTTTKTVNLSNKSIKQQVITKNQHQHEMLTTEPEISIGGVPKTTTNLSRHLSNKSTKQQVTKNQHQHQHEIFTTEPISVVDVPKTTTNTVNLSNKSTKNQHQQEMFITEPQISIAKSTNPSQKVLNKSTAKKPTNLRAISPSFEDNPISLPINLNRNRKLEKQPIVEKQKPADIKLVDKLLINPDHNQPQVPLKKYRQTSLFERHNSGDSTVSVDQNQKIDKDEGKQTQITSEISTISVIDNKDQGKQTPTKIVKAIKDLFDNFKSVKSLKNLLSPEESHLLHKFEMMNENQQYIVIKMYIRKKKWYNVLKFCEMVDIEYTRDVGEDFHSLCKQDFLEYFNPNTENIEENLEQLELAQIKKIVIDLNISSKDKTKKHMIKSILNKCDTQMTLTKKTFKDVVIEKVTKIFGKVIRIKYNVVEAFNNFCLLAIFTNSAFEDIQDYLRYNGTVFPEVPLGDDFPIFYSREKFLEYADAIRLKKKLESIFLTPSSDQKLTAINELAKQAYNFLTNIDDSDDHANDPHLNRYTAAHVYRKLLSTCCEKLFAKKNEFSSQVKQWLEFLINKFPSSKRLGKWYHTLIGLHMRHLETISYDTAASLLIEVLSKKASCLGERIKYELELLGNSLKNNKTRRIHENYRNEIAELIPSLIDINSIPVNRFSSQAIPSTSIGRKRMYTSKSDDGVTILNVETIALLEYKKDGYFGGDHSEGAHIHQLLMLYFWDIFYNVEELVECVFISKLQNAPLDIFSEYFYDKRKESITKRLKEIEYEWSQEKLLEFGINNWVKHSHKWSVFGAVNLVLDNKEMVRDLLGVIGRKVLAKIFQRLVKNLGETKSGMPDLLVWNSKMKTHKFVEVKGKNDKLAAHQILWLSYLQEAGANVEICYVDSSC